MIPASDGAGVSQNAALLNHLRTLQSDFQKFDAAKASTSANPPPMVQADHVVSHDDLQAVAADTQHTRFSQADVEAAEFFLDHPEALPRFDPTAQDGGPPLANQGPGNPASGLNCTPQPVLEPGWHPGQVDAGPDNFSLSLKGPDPDLAVGGTHDQQEAQRDQTVRLSGYAAASYESRALPGGARWPGDAQVADILSGLSPNPPLGADGPEVTHALYQSDIPGASPDQVFAHWTNHPNEVFNAGGMEIRPPTATLHDGRYMLETGGTNAPPTWLPVEIKVDPAAHSINIKTLDGHVLRGEQTFYFRDDGCGGTRIVQDARFQASSKLTGDMQKFLPISQGQHQAWQAAHRETYEQFNGDPGYKGIGDPYVDPLSQGISLGEKAALQALSNPGRAVDGGIDLGGDVINFGFDLSGRLDAKLADGAGATARRILDVQGLPGGAQAQEIAHDTGQFLSEVQDKAGDLVEGTADKLGDGAKKVVDFFDPFH